MTHPALTPGNTAVITGGASGIGLACAKAFAARGMQVCIADVNEADLTQAAREIDGEVLPVRTDVSNFAEVEALRDQALAAFGRVSVLMNNAGISARGAGPWTGLDAWHRILNTNLWGVVHGLQAFVPAMIEQGGPGAVICTGSKQGLTNPPGNTAYNVSKAGIRAIAEGVAHELRNTEGCEITAHLLVPGFAYTGMIRQFMPEKPPAAWHPEQVAERLVERMDRGDFYIVCPDNDVTEEMDNKRLQWNTDDIIQNRPALSRWHPDYAEAFERFMEKAQR